MVIKCHPFTLQTQNCLFADNVSMPLSREEHRLQNCVLHRNSGIAAPNLLARKSVVVPLLHCQTMANLEVSNWLDCFVSVPSSRCVTIGHGLICSNVMQPKHTHAYSNTHCQSNNVLYAGQHFLEGYCFYSLLKKQLCVWWKTAAYLFIYISAFSPCL